MKREDLSNLNLSDDQINKIMDLHGSDVEKSKQKYETLKAERDGLSEQLTGANNKLKGYDPEWSKKADTLKAEYEGKIGKIKLDYAIGDALKSAKVKNPDIVKKLLDTSTISQTDAGIVGLKEQLDGLKTSAAYLFDSDNNDNNSNSNSDTTTPQFSTPNISHDTKSTDSQKMAEAVNVLFHNNSK